MVDANTSALSEEAAESAGEVDEVGGGAASAAPAPGPVDTGAGTGLLPNRRRERPPVDYAALDGPSPNKWRKTLYATLCRCAAPRLLLYRSSWSATVAQ